jgi:hypothetical protein
MGYGTLHYVGTLTEIFPESTVNEWQKVKLMIKKEVKISWNGSFKESVTLKCMDRSILFRGRQ